MGWQRVNLDSLDRANSWLVAFVLLIFLVAATQVGFVIGARARRREQNGISEAMTIQAAVLGLLALLLGFSFSMAMNRYDNRKRLVVEEANAIGTTYLRARMLPQDHGVPIRRLLRQYVDNRLQFHLTGMDRDTVRRELERTNGLQEQLWSHAIAAVNTKPQPVPTGLFVQSLNDVIDDHAKRVQAFEDQVPDAIFVGIYVVAILAMSLTGRVCGLVDNRHVMPTMIAALLITLVIFMINDLDRPQQGIIRVSQQSMINLRDSISRDARRSNL